jgi:hypothetical protein
MSADLLVLKMFLSGFIKKQEEFFRKRKEIEQPILRKIFLELLDLDCKRQLFIKENAPYFNIFSIMRYGHYETRLHTPFLIHLLTPNGHHQIQLKFFKALIDSIFINRANEETVDFIESEIKNIRVFEEYVDHHLEGRIDIFIQFLYKNENYLIAIENKINADDQEDQLYRYYKFLKYLQQNERNIRLVYLTKYGSIPKIPYSISQKEYDTLSERGILKLLSYKKDIASWITQIQSERIPGAVNEILKQYLQILNHF